MNDSVCFYSKIADEQGRFDIADVCKALTDKLIYRHPHIYGEVKADTPDAVKENWEQLKLKEKGGNKSVLAGVPDALPSLIKAYRIQEKASNVGFDWDDAHQVWDKVKEEIAEVQAEIEKGNVADIEKEFGDLLFSIVNAARLYGVHPETALEKTYWDADDEALFQMTYFNPQDGLLRTFGILMIDPRGPEFSVLIMEDDGEGRGWDSGDGLVVSWPAEDRAQALEGFKALAQRCSPHWLGEGKLAE